MTEKTLNISTIRLLHVEDNPGDALLMREYIGGVLPGATFDNAERIAEVTTVRAEAADCALLDLSLPDASGLDALLVLRNLSERLPIIVLTGFDNFELGLAAVREGADDYLVKNHVDGSDLERAVRYAIERRGMLLEYARSAAESRASASGPDGGSSNFFRPQAQGGWGEKLDEAACLRLLRSAATGRLGYTTPAGMRFVYVRFVVEQNTIVFRTGHGEAAFARGCPIVFEVDQIDEFFKGGSSVVVSGVAEEVPVGSIRALQGHRALEPSPAEPSPVYLRVGLDSLSGQRNRLG
jgi:DNA-binding NarL/FixJ family response regulator